jgi:adhesin transport system membrane fusion protein
MTTAPVRPSASPTSARLLLASDPWLALVTRPRAAILLARILGIVLILAIIALAVVPWQQFSTAAGNVFAYTPALRRQNIDAPISGRIERWHVSEGEIVRAGEPIVTIADNDPDLLDRLRVQLEAHRIRVESLAQRRTALDERLRNLRDGRIQALASADQRIDMARQRLQAAATDEAAAEARLETAQLNQVRQSDLALEGLASTRTRELADLEERQARAALDRTRASRRAAQSELRSVEADRARTELDLQAQIDSALSDLRQAEVGEQDARLALTQFETQIARQQIQIVRAPRDGRVLSILYGEGGIQVREGVTLATFVPEENDRAVELLLKGIDGPLVRRGQQVRLQFEGWPVIQFAGWPDLAVGTFGGLVDFVDPADIANGRFRVVVIPDPDDYPWPDPALLRQGTRANAWIMHNEVSLGYEVWRLINGFPPDLPTPRAMGSPR